MGVNSHWVWEQMWRCAEDKDGTEVREDELNQKWGVVRVPQGGQKIPVAEVLVALTRLS